ncbi:MAG: rhodanese-like domain-containing protein [Thermoanaerobaculia bacterium]
MLARLMGLDTLAPRALHQRMQDDRITVFDVNSRGSWLAARIPGARHLDFVTIRESDLPAERSRTLVFYCSNPLCRKAPLAARQARKLGFTAVFVLSAGISGWVAAGLPTEAGA